MKIQTFDQAYEFQNLLLAGKVSEVELLDVFEKIDFTEITPDILAGFVKSSAEHMLEIVVDFDVLDIVGTGGDMLNTFNISTCAAIVVASAGYKVAKHGNRSASGKCGSADVLEYLGYDLAKSTEEAISDLAKKGFVFLFAKKYHPAFAVAGEVRKKFGRKTYFNLLGPLLNPAHAKFMVLGVADKSLMELMAEAAIMSGLKRVVVVSSQEGMDEVSVSGTTNMLFAEGDLRRKETFDPRDFGFIQHDLSALKINDVMQSADVLSGVLKSTANQACIDAVTLSAGFGIHVISAKPLAECFAEAKDQIRSGAAGLKLAEVLS